MKRRRETKNQLAKSSRCLFLHLLVSLQGLLGSGLSLLEQVLGDKLEAVATLGANPSELELEQFIFHLIMHSVNTAVQKKRSEINM